MRQTVFISHATPDDNDFTRWLALKLIALGYDVWCDVLFLDKGVDFWSKIESVIRNETCKFLFVSTAISNSRPGVLKEVAVAEKMKSKLQDETFIIPLAIDINHAYADDNIDIIRLNGIDFKKSWAKGLQDLLEAFQKQGIPCNTPDPDKANLLYQQIFLHDKGIIEREQLFDSNWFEIVEFPAELRFHLFDRNVPRNHDLKKLPYPAVRYKKYLCTFAYHYDFIEQFPKTYEYGASNSIRIPTVDILSGVYEDRFISNREAQRLIVQLVNSAFEMQMRRFALQRYQMSNKSGYYFEKDQLEKDKINKTLMVGKMKEKMWHFGISAAGKLYPSPILMISAHVYFTTDGHALIDSDRIQHAARRKRSRSWWNNDWRKKLLAFAGYLANGEETFYLEAGAEERIYISSEPMKFIGNVTYDVPQKDTPGNEEDDVDYPYDSDDLEEFEEFEEENTFE